MHYVMGRLVLVIPLLLGISIITFTIINLAPGDPISAMINPAEMNLQSPQQMEAQREALGLNKPIPVRYFRWLTQTLRGNFGYSIQNHRPVLNVILDRLPASLGLTVPAMVLAVVIGVALGVFSAVHQYTIFDYMLTVTAFFGVSVPSFFIALMGMYVFAVRLHWLPVFGMWTPGEPTGFTLDLVRHSILPIIGLAVPQVAGYMRYARAAMLDALGAEHVTTAKAKGLSPRIVFRRHVFRNALMPLVTIIGLSLPSVIGGSFIIETIFSWPGVGLLGYTAILQRDYPIQLGIALMAAVAVLLVNLFTDLMYAVVDPRIRYE
jgi:peptide/nickel transport system permease protein